MKKSVFLTFSILVISSISCSKTEYSSAEIEKNFTTEQISDLKKITAFFKKSICDDLDFKTCFQQINEDSLLLSSSGIWVKIDFDEQKKIYNQISVSTFNEIWDYCYSTYKPNNIKVKSLCVEPMGRYQNYLADIGKTNPRITRYVRDIQETGTFGFFDFTYAEIINANETFDLDDPNIQLILAIHYLSINDELKRNAHLISEKHQLLL